MNKNFPLIAGAILFVGFILYDNFAQQSGSGTVVDGGGPVAPNWASIAAWPTLDIGAVEATPDPNRRITAIVLDDSGSMGKQMAPAKAAVLQALSAMGPDDRVAVVALNDGVVLPFTRVAEATAPLAAALRNVHSDGGTPLTAALTRAKDMLETEAASARAFGTYRMIVTTDGVADDGKALTAVLRNMASDTPIQIATIGIGIEGGHVLRRNDLGRFVDVANVSALQSALQDAIAENSDFTAITEFGEGN